MTNYTYQMLFRACLRKQYEIYEDYLDKKKQAFTTSLFMEYE